MADRGAITAPREVAQPGHQTRFGPRHRGLTASPCAPPSAATLGRPQPRSHQSLHLEVAVACGPSDSFKEGSHLGGFSLGSLGQVPEHAPLLNRNPIQDGSHVAPLNRIPTGKVAVQIAKAKVARAGRPTSLVEFRSHALHKPHLPWARRELVSHIRSCIEAVVCGRRLEVRTTFRSELGWCPQLRSCCPAIPRPSWSKFLNIKSRFQPKSRATLLAVGVCCGQCRASCRTEVACVAHTGRLRGHARIHRVAARGTVAAGCRLHPARD